MRGTPIPWPALVYVGLVDQAGISEHKYRPVEYLVDRTLDYHDYTQLQPYQDGECAIVCGEECGRAVRAWVGEQDGQRILLTTPSVLVGFRVQVYRAEGTTQWYTAVIVGYNHATRELTVTDDTVLEEHSEDPSLVQIRLIGEGVVESILRGENVGITPRRSRTATNNHHQTGVRHIRRDGVVPARTRKNSLSRPNNLPPTASHTLPPAPTHPPLPPLQATPPVATTTTAPATAPESPATPASSPAPAVAAPTPASTTSSSSSSSSSNSSSTPTTLKLPEPPPLTEDKQKGEQQQQQKSQQKQQQQQQEQKQQKQDQEKCNEEAKEEERPQEKEQHKQQQKEQQQQQLREEQKQKEAEEREEQKKREMEQKEEQKKRELQQKEEQRKKELQQ
ncbi:PH domain-containing protein DDB_G0287875-like, partial [Penaeus monodon]|uniref:PH domain-containing protein DDB_G0287875-like n=1 Tax=Penaeus monodon TaxID=6687 RepID=UPI0018A79754